MRPVNLIPEETRRKQVSGKTGPTPYLVLALLGFAVIASGTYVWLSNQVTGKQDELANLTTQVDQTTAKAQRLAPYARFGLLKQQRVAAVQGVVDSRFPWAGVLLDVAKAMPNDAWLVQMTGKVSPGAKTGDQSSSGGSGGGGGGGGSNTGSSSNFKVAGPTVTLVGCTYRQAEVARMMVRLRNIDGVAQVLLDSSEEPGDSASSQSGQASASGDDCRTRQSIHKFTVTVTFPPGEATQVAESAAAGTSSGSASAPPPASSESKPPAGSGSSSTAQPVSGSRGAK